MMSTVPQPSYQHTSMKSCCRNPRLGTTNSIHNVLRLLGTSRSSQRKGTEHSWAQNDRFWLFAVGILRGCLFVCLFLQNKEAVSTERGIDASHLLCEHCLGPKHCFSSGRGKQTAWAEQGCTADVVPLYFPLHVWSTFAWARLHLFFQLFKTQQLAERRETLRTESPGLLEQKINSTVLFLPSGINMKSTVKFYKLWQIPAFLISLNVHSACLIVLGKGPEVLCLAH